MVQRTMTQREMEILQLVASGYRNRDIAGVCSISEQTVKNHVSKLLLKLGVANRTQAATFALKAGLQKEIDAGALVLAMRRKNRANSEILKSDSP